jgi:hypothetical protein
VLGRSVLTLELNKDQRFSEADFPLVAGQARITLSFDFAVDVPPAAARRKALRWLRELVADAVDEDLQPGSPRPLSADEPRGAQHGNWIQPAGMDLRVLKSAHRLVLEVSRRGQSGKPVLAAELAKEAGLSAPTLGRLLREGEAAHDYLRQFVAITPNGRTKGLDLTPAGRLLASRIRAGTIPA